VNQPAHDSQLAYATPVPYRNYWPSAILCFTAVAMFVVGGCFLIGVMILTNQAMVTPWAATTAQLRPAQMMLLITLYACCAVCMIAGVTLLFLGVRKLR
jgi:drug/metabolite transporter superfamily protein YnfA